MKYLSNPTELLPNGRLIVEREFIAAVVDSVNQLNDAVVALQKRVDDVDGQNKSAIANVADGLAKANQAISKIADAFDLILKGEGK